jgi:hypothetical protein
MSFFRPAGRRRVRAGVVGALLLTAAGCGGSVDTLAFSGPPPTTVAPPPAPDTLPPGLASMSEVPVPGLTTTTTVAMSPGGASLNGTVMGPTGPVGGATVEIDRFVGTAFAFARTTTALDGSWSFRGLLGGDYRVRAWQPPVLDMDTPQTLFLAAGQPQTLTLQLQSYAAQQVQVAINPAGPVQGQPANLVIQVTKPNVNAAGVLTAPPVAGAKVTLVDGPAWQVDNGNPLTTDASGQATFEVTCSAAGNDPLSAQVGAEAPVVLQMPPCGSSPVTTTTAPPATGFPTTTACTTVPPGPGPTDTTTTLAFGQC